MEVLGVPHAAEDRAVAPPAEPAEVAPLADDHLRGHQGVAEAVDDRAEIEGAVDVARRRVPWTASGRAAGAPMSEKGDPWNVTPK